MNAVVRGVAAIVAVLLPLALLADPHSAFYVDWYNNLWLVAMHGQALRWHHAFPSVLNTDELVGMPVPMFYGYLLYPTLGVVSSVTGAHLAIRLGCVGLVSLEFYALSSAGRAIFRHRGLAYALAVTLIWSVYSLTDLYNRSAVPEYFATGFLTAAVALAAAALGESRPAAQAFHLWSAGLCAALALGSHPPTAILAAPLLGGLVLAAAVAALRWEGGRSRAVAAGGVAFALAGLAVAPWLYINLRWARHLGIWGQVGPMMYIRDRCDNALSRFLPFPYDPLGLVKGVAVSTPYLEAPLAFGLWVMLIWLIAVWLRDRGREGPSRPTQLARWVLPCALLWAAFLIVLSLYEPLSAAIGYLAPSMQFAYRLVSHCNIALAVAVLAAGVLARGAILRRREQASVVAGICVAIAALNVGLKLAHAQTVLGHIEAVEPLLHGRPDVANTFRQYGTPRRLRELTAEEAAHAAAADFVLAERGRRFDEPQPLRLRLAASSWVETNALLFPFARIFANGRRIEGDDLARQGERIAVRLPAGETTLTWVWHVDPLWAALRRAGMFAYGALIAGAFWFGVAAFRSRPRSCAAPTE